MQPSDSNVNQQPESFLHYRGNAIPWYVRLMWVGFWCFAIYYTLQFAIPALQREVFTP